MRRSAAKRFSACLALALIGAFSAGFQNFAFAQAASPETPQAKIQYVLAPIAGGMKELQRRFNDMQIALLEKLNRVDLKHLSRLRNIVVPSVWTGNELDYSPFPAHYPPAEKISKVLIVDISGQAFGAYEKGNLIRWGPVSTGRKSRPTPSGLFHLNWRSPGRHSTVNSEWYMPWYFNFDNKQGISLHQYEMPGYPASHECIRLLEADARWLYNWGEEWTLGKKRWQVLKPGTELLILNHYDYGSQPLWHSQEWLTHGVRLPEAPLRAFR
ncbi:MAG: L,D-transpeptidase family protein [Syntrophales bacterium]|nr:L,D-transpeptidase family protein [Syntrophales bacterium]